MVGEDAGQIGVVPAGTALRLAEERGLDLVEIVPGARPPVCKIMDYGKYKYMLTKKEKTARKKQKVIHVKEIKVRPKIDVHDLNTKVKHAEEFLLKGDKVKVTVMFRGREMAHQDIGRGLMDKVKAALDGVAKVENEARMEGNNMVAVLAPKEKK